ncbi:ATP-binding cassette domain-containing protein [Myxococcota bacterium]|nr:ATP-binding cassette domain-containing protein [Myxococcota bacterium]MBU1534221.1 ATP-binding cassette domain-containing protein [Myxococcota bacterium]
MIHVSNLHLTIGGRPLLQGMDLHVESGSVWGIIGPPGGGKSLFVKTLCGLFRPDRGSIIIDGTEIVGLSEPSMVPVRRKIGMLFQNNALFDFMRVWENVAFPLARLRPELSQDTLRERSLMRLQEVGLLGSEDKWPAELSGGMKKRVGIARATMTDAPLVIYDEPTAGLDPVTTSKIYDLLEKIRQETGATVLAISSDIEGLSTFVKNMMLIHEGRFLFQGPLSELTDCGDPLVHQFIRGLEEGPL